MWAACTGQLRHDDVESTVHVSIEWVAGLRGSEQNWGEEKEGRGKKWESKKETNVHGSTGTISGRKDESSMVFTPQRAGEFVFMSVTYGRLGRGCKYGTG